jgi:hypothetical protein
MLVRRSAIPQTMIVGQKRKYRNGMTTRIG